LISRNFTDTYILQCTLLGLKLILHLVGKDTPEAGLEK